MTRTQKQLDEEGERSYPVKGSLSHSSGCSYPTDPCNCEVYNEQLRRKSHANYCDYPNNPCGCGVC